MKKTRMTVFLMLVAAMMLCLNACGGEKAALEISSVTVDAEKETVTINYTCGREIAGGEWSYKVTLTQNNDKIKGTLYCVVEGKDKREKGSNYMQMFMVSGTSKWTTEGDFTYNGETGSGEVGVVDVLKEFGSGTTVKVTFYVNDEVVAEETKTIE